MSLRKTGFALAMAGAALAAPTLAQDAAILAAAKKEGSVTWYTTQIVNQFAAPTAAAFEKKYGVRVNYVRADNNEQMLRLQAEAKAGRMQGDVFDGTVASPLIRAGLVLKWQPESVKALPKDYQDPEGYWSVTNLYVHTPAINTSLVPKDAIPKSHQDFLDPRWKGKLVWSNRQSTSSAAGYIGSVLAEMGEAKGMAHLRELQKQNVAALGVSARQVLDQVIAGEYPVALNIFNHHATISAGQGAPADWLRISPAVTVFSVAGITKDAPHPNAAKLLLDFLVSEEGQQLYRAADYIPVHPKVPARDPDLRPDGVKLKGLFVRPDETEAKTRAWHKIYQEIFR